MASPTDESNFPIASDILAADEKTAFSEYDDESGLSSTQSLSSSILETTFANGRRYHRKSQGQYFMPSDEAELDRLDLTHHLYLELLDGELHTAPLSGPVHNVLDIGTGTGIWALDFGEVHPETKVLGVDLAPIQPSWVFPNVVFETDDIEKEWLWKQKFDFIFCRTMAIAIRDWPRLAGRVFQNTASGGWVEIVDHGLRQLWCDDNSAPKDSGVKIYMEKVSACLEAAGMNVDISEKYFEKLLEEAGFVDIRVFKIKMPLGAWAKDKKYKRVGRIAGETATTGFESYGLAALVAGGTPPDEAKKICDAARDIVSSGKEHWYNIVYSVAARKPEDA